MCRQFEILEILKDSFICKIAKPPWCGMLVFILYDKSYQLFDIYVFYTYIILPICHATTCVGTVSKLLSETSKPAAVLFSSTDTFVGGRLWLSCGRLLNNYVLIVVNTVYSRFSRYSRYICGFLRYSVWGCRTTENRDLNPIIGKVA